METHEPINYDPISKDEACAALASAERSRARVAWSGYPAWYWLLTGAGLGAVSYAVELPGWWNAVAIAAAAVVLLGTAYAASKARGICEGWVRSAMSPRDVAILYGPAAFVIMANAAVSKVASWATIVVAVLIFVAFAATGLALSARANRS